MDYKQTFIIDSSLIAITEIQFIIGRSLAGSLSPSWVGNDTDDERVVDQMSNVSENIKFVLLSSPVTQELQIL